MFTRKTISVVGVVVLLFLVAATSTIRWSQIRQGESPFINVKTSPYNAVGDGSANDTVAIKAALADAVAIKGTVFFPVGTYKITPDQVVSGANVRIQCAGRFNTLFVPAASGTTLVEVNGGGNNSIEIHDCGFDATAFPTVTNLLKISHANYVRVDNLFFNRGVNGLVIGDASNWGQYSNFWMLDQSGHAIDITETTPYNPPTTYVSAEQWFNTIFIYSTIGGHTMDVGFYYKRLTAIDIGVMNLQNIHVQTLGGNINTGIECTSDVPYTTFNLFIENSYSDAITGGPALLYKNGGGLRAIHNWFANNEASGTHAAIEIDAGSVMTFTSNDIFSNNGAAISLDNYPTNLRFVSNTIASPTYAFSFLNVASGWANGSLIGNITGTTVLSNHPDRLTGGGDSANYFSGLRVLTNNYNVRGTELTLDDDYNSNARGMRNNNGLIEYRTAAGTGTAQRFKDNGGLGLLLGGVPIYANNAAAVSGGLASGDFYRSGADPDVLSIVHP